MRWRPLWAVLLVLVFVLVGGGACGRPVRPAGVQLVDAPPGDVAALVQHELGVGPGPVLVYVGATWCEPCRRFHTAAAAGQLDGALPQLRLLVFDLDRDGERLKAAGYSSAYIPLFALPNPDGRASGKAIAGSIKGDGAVGNIVPRLQALLR